MITKKDIFCGCKCFLVKCVNCRGCKYYFSDVTSLFCFPEADVALRFWIFWENPTLDSRAKIIWLRSELKKKALENGFSESVPAMQATSENVTDPMFSRESYWPGAPLLPVLTCFTSFFIFSLTVSSSWNHGTGLSPLSQTFSDAGRESCIIIIIT